MGWARRRVGVLVCSLDRDLDCCEICPKGRRGRRVGHEFMALINVNIVTENGQSHKIQTHPKLYITYPANTSGDVTQCTNR